MGLVVLEGRRREPSAATGRFDDRRPARRWRDTLPPVTTYLILGVAGLVLLAVSLVVGDLLDGVLDGALGGLSGDWFSTEVVGGFVSALGFGGAIALGFDAPDVVAAAVGIAAGVTFGFLAASLTRLVRGGGTDATPSTSDMVGQTGSVISAIPADGLGTVRVRLGGHTLRYSARAEIPLDAGTEVHVTGVLSPTAVEVAPTWSALPPTSRPTDD